MERSARRIRPAERRDNSKETKGRKNITGKPEKQRKHGQKAEGRERGKGDGEWNIMYFVEDIYSKVEFLKENA